MVQTSGKTMRLWEVATGEERRMTSVANYSRCAADWLLMRAVY